MKTMKTNLFLFIFFAIGTFPVLAQTDLTLAFNDVYIGRNISATATYQIKKHRILAGIKYGINSFEHDNQNNMFKNRFFATNFLEHWGLVVGYQRSINVNKPNFELFWFYEFQFTNSHVRIDHNAAWKANAAGDLIWHDRNEAFYGPTIALENNIGIGMNIQLSDRFFLTQKAGFGGVNYRNIQERFMFRNSLWDFSYLLSIGITYRLKEKK